MKIWFEKNKLLLNLNKTKIMIFGKCKTHNQVRVQMEDVNMERVNEKFLGVIIDDKICWKPQTYQIQTVSQHFSPGKNKARTRPAITPHSV